MKTQTTYTIDEAKKGLQDIFTAYCTKMSDGRYIIPEVNRIPVYLIGPPGIGKTQIVEETAKACNIGFVSYSLVHHTRNSLLGLPVIVDGADGSKHTEYTVSEIIASVLEKYEAGYEEGVVFLDEFPCMSDTIAPVMLSFLQQKKLGKHKLPEGWTIVLAGNPPQYNKSVRKFDTATTDRMRIMNIEYDTEVWLQYAQDTKVNPQICDYIAVNRDALFHYDPEYPGEVVTPRSWVNLSDTIKAYESLGLTVDLKLILQFVKNCKTSVSFYKYYTENKERLSVREMDKIYRYGAADHEMRNILDRMKEIKDQRMLRRMLEDLARYSVHRAMGEIETEGAEPRLISECLKNVYDFMDHIDSYQADTGTGIRNGEMSKLMTERVNTCPEIIKLLSEYELPAYNHHMMATYNVMSSQSA
ncbi:MAG: AAA family ATPase [Lachnospiraceae bacterium]|nr:AAA family ATPase [Lachnospiraceae bacterium]